MWQKNNRNRDVIHRFRDKQGQRLFMHMLCHSVLQRVKNYCFHWFSIFVVEEISVIKSLPNIFCMFHEPLILHNMGSFTMTLFKRIVFVKISLHFYMAISYLFRHDHLSTHLIEKPKSFIVHATQHKRVLLIWDTVRNVLHNK